jgi:hypothetical protein
MKKLFFLVIIFVIVTIVSWNCKDQYNPIETKLEKNSSTSLAATGVYSENYSEPIRFTHFIPCAAGGAGENVEFFGTLHILFRYTLNKNGIYSLESEHNPNHLMGIGLSSGEKYVGTGITQFHQITGKINEAYTFTDNFRLIGQGPDNNFTVKETLHYTVNANGKMTVDVDNYSEECN